MVHPTAQHRSSGLDLLRFVAILLVIGRHLQLNESAPAWIRTWNCGGWVGVDLFFVLSGFLVSSLLFNELRKSGTLNVGRFFVRRAFRILPAFWLCIGISIVGQLLLNDPPRIRELAGEAFFVQNYLGGVWPHTWSLAVEIHFYLMLPWLMLWLHRREVAGTNRASDSEPHVASAVLPAIPVCFAAIMMSCFALRCLSFLVFPEFHARIHLFGTHLRIDSLMLGVYLAWRQQSTATGKGRTEVRHSGGTLLLWVTGFLLLAPAFVCPLETSRGIAIAGVTVFALGSGCLVLAAGQLSEASATLIRPLSAIGAASYSIYLWHFPVQKWLWPIVQSTTGSTSLYLQVGTVVGCSCLIGFVLHHALETPILRLRDCLFPSSISTAKSDTMPFQSRSQKAA